MVGLTCVWDVRGSPWRGQTGLLAPTKTALDTVALAEGHHSSVSKLLSGFQADWKVLLALYSFAS